MDIRIFEYVMCLIFIVLFFLDEYTVSSVCDKCKHMESNAMLSLCYL